MSSNRLRRSRSVTERCGGVCLPGALGNRGDSGRVERWRGGEEDGDRYVLERVQRRDRDTGDERYRHSRVRISESRHQGEGRHASVRGDVAEVHCVVGRWRSAGLDAFGHRVGAAAGVRRHVARNLQAAVVRRDEEESRSRAHCRRTSTRVVTTGCQTTRTRRSCSTTRQTLRRRISRLRRPGAR